MVAQGELLLGSLTEAFSPPYNSNHLRNVFAMGTRESSGRIFPLPVAIGYEPGFDVTDEENVDKFVSVHALQSGLLVDIGSLLLLGRDRITTDTPGAGPVKGWIVQRMALEISSTNERSIPVGSRLLVPRLRFCFVNALQTPFKFNQNAAVANSVGFHCPWGLHSSSDEPNPTPDCFLCASYCSSPPHRHLLHALREPSLAFSRWQERGRR